MAFLLSFSAYISLAWYDLWFHCLDRLHPTLLGYLSGPFKPSEYNEEAKQLPLRDKKIIRNVDIAVLFVIVLTFLYPFFFHYRLRK
jgi:hypothetical protein